METARTLRRSGAETKGDVAGVAMLPLPVTTNRRSVAVTWLWRAVWGAWVSGQGKILKVRGLWVCSTPPRSRFVGGRVGFRFRGSNTRQNSSSCSPSACLSLSPRLPPVTFTPASARLAAEAREGEEDGKGPTSLARFAVIILVNLGDAHTPRTLDAVQKTLEPLVSR